MPSPTTLALQPAPMIVTGAPQSTLYCHWSTVPPPSSGTSTVPAGTPCCHSADGAVVSSPAVAYGGRSDPHTLAAEAVDGTTAMSATASRTTNTRNRGFTPRLSAG